MYLGNLTLLAPAIFLSFAAIVVLLLGVCAAKKPDKGIDHWLPTQYLAPVAMIGGLFFAGITIWQSLYLAGRITTATIDGVLTRVPATCLFVTGGGQAQLVIDPFSSIVAFLAIAGTFVVMLLSLEHFGEHQIHKAEYYSLLMFATVAAILASAASDLIAVYLSIEFLSMVSYVLAAFAKNDRRSSEAGLKYFLYGAACSAIMLYGMSLVFGACEGNTSFTAIADVLKGGAAETGIGWVGIMFMLVGLGFKIALVPFHFWAPDTYEGAPTPITAFLSVVSKAAGIAVLVRFLSVAVLPAAVKNEPIYLLDCYWVLVILAAVSMFYGNLVAIPQRNIKRMLAYSSIAQVGYMLVGILAAVQEFSPVDLFGLPYAAVRSSVSYNGPSQWGLQGVLIYIIAYLFMNLGAFAVVIAVANKLKSNSISSYAGLFKRSPFYAGALAVFLISLAGIPPTSGFLGKFFIFGSAIKVGLNGHTELVVLAVIGVINSIISVFYYFNVVRLMFFEKPDSKLEVRGTNAVKSAVLIALAITLFMIVVAKPIADITSNAVYSSSAVGIIRVSH